MRSWRDGIVRGSCPGPVSGRLAGAGEPRPCTPVARRCRWWPICQIKDEERRLGRVAFRLWWEGFAVDLAVIREQLASAMDPLEDEIRKAGAGEKSAPQGILSRSLGRERIEAITAMVAQAAFGRERAAGSGVLGGYGVLAAEP